MKKRILDSKLIPPLLTLVGVLWLMEALVRKGFINDYLLPAPSQVFKSFWVDGDALYHAGLSTFVSASVGLFLSFFIGTLLAILFSVSKFARRAVYPYAIFFQTVPV